ncbi:hypothetical protein LSAT2_020738 [Lamellibrachia satsuma]|nr:hypothetical protein LSAT2_020738 [Lamellibrachia satsuma]
MTMAAKVGLKCSTFTSCRYTVLSGESAQCGVGYTGYSYIHVEYECLTRHYPTTTRTISYAGMLGEDNVDGKLIYMMSDEYSSQWNRASHSSCRVNVPQGAALSVTIYDFLSNKSNTECSARLLVTTDTTTTVCAQAPWKQRTLSYETTPSGQTIDFLMLQKDSTVASRLFILLNATGELLVKCGADVVTLPPTTASSSTTATTVTTRNTTTTPDPRDNDNTTLTGPSAVESTTPTPSLASTTAGPSVEKSSTVNNIIDFLRDNIIAFAAAGAILFLLIVVLIILCVVSRRRRKTKKGEEHEVIDGWLWQSEPPAAAALSHPGSNASTLNKPDTIDPYSMSSSTRTAPIGWSDATDSPSPQPNTSDIYAVPMKKKNPKPKDTEPTYTNVQETKNSELVYGYAREIS